VRDPFGSDNQRSTACLAISGNHTVNGSPIDVRELTGRTPRSAGAFIEEERERKREKERDARTPSSDERADG